MKGVSLRTVVSEMKKDNMIAFHKKQNVSFPLCILLVLFFILCSGCQKKQEEREWLLTGEGISVMESLYGKDRAATLEILHLSESDISKGDDPGVWDLAEPVLVEGKEFSESLLFEISAETCYGVRFMSRFEDAEELSGYVEKVLEIVYDAYGEPSTYPGLPNRLTSEDFSRDLSEAMNSGTTGNWREDWNIGEKTICTLSVRVVETNVAVMCFEYIIEIPRSGS